MSSRIRLPHCDGKVPERETASGLDPLSWDGFMRSYVFLAINSSFKVFARNRLRSGLTMLSIIIGIATVMTVVGIVQGARAVVESQLAMMGENLIFIRPVPKQLGVLRIPKGPTATLTTRDAQAIKDQALAESPTATLTARDAQAIKDQAVAVREVCWWHGDLSQVIRGKQNWHLPVIGVNPGCFSVHGREALDGVLFSQLEMGGASSVAVLGQTAVEHLYEEGDEPNGSTLIIKGVPLTAIGVLRARGQSPTGFDLDNLIFIPFSTAQRRVHGARFRDAVEGISLSVFNREDLPRATEEIRSILRDRHRLRELENDDFMLRTQDEVVAIHEATNRTLGQLLVLVAVISLAVGGIGLMNILLVSVTERTREIGVRIAVGAKRRHILMQFLIEAMTLFLIGGCLGILFGILGARLTTAVAGWPTIISATTIAAVLAFSVTVGLFFGLYPANKASRLNPVEALRAE